jgi:hypothetical protein
MLEQAQVAAKPMFSCSELTKHAENSSSRASSPKQDALVVYIDEGFGLMVCQSLDFQAVH